MGLPDGQMLTDDTVALGNAFGLAIYEVGDIVVAAQPEGYPVAFRQIKEAEPLCDIPNGRELQVIERDSGDDWLKVDVSELEGWVKKRNVQPSPALLERW